MYDTLVNDFGLSIGLFFGPNKRKVEKIIEGVEKLMGRIDEVLDKPMDENTPHFCCGDFLEQLKEKLTELTEDFEYYEKIFRAKSAAWEKFPDEDGDEDARISQNDHRSGYMQGYMDALKIV